MIAGNVITPVSTPVSCGNGMTVRSVIRDNIILVYVNTVLSFGYSDNDITSGLPGVGVLNAPAGKTGD